MRASPELRLLDTHKVISEQLVWTLTGQFNWTESSVSWALIRRNIEVDNCISQIHVRQEFKKNVNSE